MPYVPPATPRLDAVVLSGTGGAATRHVFFNTGSPGDRFAKIVGHLRGSFKHSQDSAERLAEPYREHHGEDANAAADANDSNMASRGGDANAARAAMLVAGVAKPDDIERQLAASIRANRPNMSVEEIERAVRGVPKGMYR